MADEFVMHAFDRVNNMASLIFVNRRLLALMLLFVVLFCFKLAQSEMGIAGTGMGYLPAQGGGSAVTSKSGGDEPEEVVVKALQCFNEKHIYSSCEESYRLTQSGQLNIPPDYTDEYCNGACVQETQLVLNCVDNILSHFIFYNHATIKDVKETIKIGCSYGPHKGDFNVAEHIEGDESNSNKLAYPIILFGLLSFIIIFNLVF